MQQPWGAGHVISHMGIELLKSIQLPNSITWIFNIMQKLLVELSKWIDTMCVDWARLSPAYRQPSYLYYSQSEYEQSVRFHSPRRPGLHTTTPKIVGYPSQWLIDNSIASLSINLTAIMAAIRIPASKGRVDRAAGGRAKRNGL